MSQPANFNGARPAIQPDQAAMLLIDHQSGLFQTIGDMPFTTVRAHASALARMATLSKMPVITTASVPQGPNGPLIPEIHEHAPHARYIARRGEINAWDNPDFVAAVKATGRKQLIIAGTITSVCMAFPSIAAVADGYQVFAVIDAGWLMAGLQGVNDRSTDDNLRTVMAIVSVICHQCSKFRTLLSILGAESGVTGTPSARRSRRGRVRSARPVPAPSP